MSKNQNFIKSESLCIFSLGPRKLVDVYRNNSIFAVNRSFQYCKSLLFIKKNIKV